MFRSNRLMNKLNRESVAASTSRRSSRIAVRCTWYAAIVLTLTILVAERAVAEHLDAATMLKALSSKYTFAKSIIVRFSEGEGQAKIRGIVTVEGTNRFRIELSDREIVCNGTTVWNYSPAEKRVTIDNYHASGRSTSPEFFITRLPANAKATLFDAKDPQHKLLQLEPANTDDWGMIQRLIVETDNVGSSVYGVTIVDESGASRTIHVQSTTFDKKLPSDTFDFKPPAGSSVVDVR